MDLKSKVTKLKTKAEQEAQALEAAARGIEAKAKEREPWVYRHPLLTAYSVMLVFTLLIIAAFHWIAR